MDSKQIIDGLKKGLETVKQLAPLLSILGPKAQGLLKTIEGVTELSASVLKLVEQGAIVVSSDDQAEIRQINAELAAENDKLAQRINQA